MKFKRFKIVKVCVMIIIKFLAGEFYFAIIISVRSTLIRKGKDPDP
jgi:hypothetical protein